MTRVCLTRFLCFHVSRLLGVSLAGMLLLSATDSYGANPRELLDSGQADEAIRVLTHETDGNNASAFNLLGRTYFTLGDWDNAVRNCERAAQIQPGNAIFLLWLGRSYGEKANVAGPVTAFALARKTVAAFTTAHALDPNNMDIARDLAEYYTQAPAIVGGGSDKALGLAAELARNHPSDAAWVRAILAVHQNNYGEAERQFTESIRLDHNSAATNLEYARFLRDAKRWEQFQQVLETAVHSPAVRPVDRYDAAELLLATNRNLPEAAQLMRNYIQSGHTQEEAPVFRAHYVLGEILQKSGDTNHAIAEYRAALALASSYRPAADALRRLGQR